MNVMRITRIYIGCAAQSLSKIKNSVIRARHRRAPVKFPESARQSCDRAIELWRCRRTQSLLQKYPISSAEGLALMRQADFHSDGDKTLARQAHVPLCPSGLLRHWGNS